MNTHTGNALLVALSQAHWFNLNSTDCCSLFRRDFWLENLPVRATTVFAAAGYGGVWLNGAKADETAVLEPGWSQWDKRLLAPKYDVTGHLNKGWNAIGLALGAGWYGHLGNVPAIKLALAMRADGNESDLLMTDGNWTMGPCPTLKNDIYNGEMYDARLEDKAWSRPGGGSQWLKATPAGPPRQISLANLSLQSMNPIRTFELLTATFVTTTPSGAFILDFGQNLAGWVRVSLSACSAGTIVTVRHAEILHENHSALDVGNLRSAKATDVYTCRGGSVEHEPRFTYHGFRFIEISVKGLAKWSWSDQRARVVHSEVQPRGWLQMGNPTLTNVQKAIRWTQLDNLHSIPTDCPQRDERLGWMGDAAVSAEQAIHNFDMQAFYANWMQVIVDAQQSVSFDDCKIPIPGGGINGSCLGAVSDTSPHVPGVGGGRPADPSWGAALPVLADLMNRYYGAIFVQRLVPAVQAWADFLLSMRQGGIVKYHYYGDWLQPGKVASDPIVSEMSAGFSSILAVYVAGQLGDNSSRSRFKAEFESMRIAFQQTYWNDTISAFGDGSQAPQVFALYFGGLSPSQENASLTCLLCSLRTKGLQTGFLSTKWLFPLLSKYGHVSLGLHLASSSAFPSWGYMIEKGATTIWEHWDAYHNPSGNAMSSHNHPGFTSIGAWYYTDLVGIRIDRDPIELGPMLDEYDELLPSASGQLMTKLGLAAVKWQMRPYVIVSGICPSTCIIRVPLDGIQFLLAKAMLETTSGAHNINACGSAACVLVPSGDFSLKLATVGELLI